MPDSDPLVAFRVYYRYPDDDVEYAVLIEADSPGAARMVVEQTAGLDSGIVTRIDGLIDHFQG